MHDDARNVIASAALVGSASLAVFALQPPLRMLVGTMAVFGVCIGAATTSAYTAAGAVIPRQVHATGFSLLTSASLIGLALSPMVSGFVAARRLRAVFGGGVVLLAILAVVARRLMVQHAPTTKAPAVEEA